MKQTKITQIKLSNIRLYENLILAKDVYIDGKLIFKNNTRITKYVISKLEQFKGGTSPIYVYEEINFKDKKNKEIQEYKDIINRINSESKLIFKNYCYNGKDDRRILGELIDKVTDSIIENTYVMNFLENLYFVSPKVLDHSIRVASITIIMSTYLNIPYEIMYDMVIGALLHDIGMIQLISESSFDITGIDSELNYEEYQFFKTHSIVGYTEISDSPYLSPLVKNIILYHHLWNNFNASYNGYFNTWISYPEYVNDIKSDAEKYKNTLTIVVQLADTYDSLVYMRTPKHFLDFKNQHPIDFISNHLEDITGSDFISTGKLFLRLFSKYSIGEYILINKNTKAKIIDLENDANNPLVSKILGYTKNGEAVLSNNIEKFKNIA